MNANPWTKLAVVSFTGIIISFLILWGIGQYSNYQFYNANAQNYSQMYGMNGSTGYGYSYNMQNNMSNGMNMQNGMGMGNGMNMQDNMNNSMGMGNSSGMSSNSGMNSNSSMSGSSGMNSSSSMSGNSGMSGSSGMMDDMMSMMGMGDM